MSSSFLYFLTYTHSNQLFTCPFHEVKENNFPVGDRAWVCNCIEPFYAYAITCPCPNCDTSVNRIIRVCLLEYDINIWLGGVINGIELDLYIIFAVR